MITQQELHVLIGLLQRTPLTPAEALWVDALLLRAVIANATVSDDDDPPEPAASSAA